MYIFKCFQDTVPLCAYSFLFHNISNLISIARWHFSFNVNPAKRKAIVMTNEYIFLTCSGINKVQELNQVIPVKESNIHFRYDNTTGENNLALLELSSQIDCDSNHLPICIPERDFAEHVLISEMEGTLSGWNANRSHLTPSLVQRPISYLSENNCKQILNRNLITREFCGYNQVQAKEMLLGGSFIAVPYKGTWFLTGVLEPWATEIVNWKTFIFTKTSRYMMWFKRIMG